MNLYIFSVDDLLVRYGCRTDSELADLLGFSKGAISIWRSNGVPDSYQRFLNVEANMSATRKKLPATA